MSSNSQDVSKMVGVYKRLFIILAIVTGLGIGIAFLHLPVWVAIGIAFIIMAIKSKVVIDSFKHLIVGRNLILVLFGLTGIFFISVILLPLLNHENSITDTVDISKQIQAEQAPMMEHKDGH